MHEITERAVCNNRAGWIFWRHSLSEQAKNVRAGWKIILKIVSKQGLILGTAEYLNKEIKDDKNSCYAIFSIVSK